MTIQDRISCLVAAGIKLHQLKDDEATLRRAVAENPWFTMEGIRMSLEAIADNFLQEEKLMQWADKYPISTTDTDIKVGLVLAGNIPMVGAHDIIASYIAGHTTLVKLSSKDKVLMTYFIEALGSKVKVVDKLEGFDAVIATGSNNTSRYFKQYFGKYPHIIRKNRNSVAVLSGKESSDDLIDLGKDIFTYFGLGCRNVSKIYIPEGYDITHLLEVLHDAYKDVAHHNKYKNNFDYNVALLLLNKEVYLNTGSLIVRQSTQIPSNISVLHYDYYAAIPELASEIKKHEAEIQCVVSSISIDGIDTVAMGQAQCPNLLDYADGVDTMTFLTSLK